MPDERNTPPNRNNKSFAREVAADMADDARSGFKMAFGIGAVLAIVGSGYGLVVHSPMVGLVLGVVGFVAGLLIGAFLAFMPVDLF